MRALRPLRPTSGLVALALALALGGPMAGCVPPIHVRSAVTPGASFDRYHTFSFGSPEGPPRGSPVSSRSPEVEQLVRSLVVTTLAQKGYALSSGKGDFVVTLSSGPQVVDVREASPPEGDQSEVESPHFDYDEVDAALVLDVHDAASGLRVWRGSSRAEVSPQRVDPTTLQRSVTMMLASFPAEHSTVR